ncbi:Pkinase-domain-containing protein [Myriangium duriaei CBS 260.36]|uniref:Serine/threonine-protein kinase BUR1 n=1 Tax=Myriangium duriaei CBS 260.36 TaxID=1168546 RepID=A0A9P4MMC5_9PEZI|nr:Pkinase-domain-containing protein [Myriangium duriaei CBS 260.36]
MAVPPANPSMDPLQRRYRGCSRLSDYEITDKLGEGTFGVVSKGFSKRTGAVVALKKILMHNEKDGFPITALREIKLLKMLSHPNVIRLDEMAVERKKGDGKKRATMYMVTPYMDHDLSGMTTNPDIQFTIPQIKCYMLQLLEGLRYLHDAHILHRDMKAANILISNKGQLQIADFGLARHYDGPTPRPGHGNGEAVRDYTALVVTRWYRPPELLLQLRRYTPAIDLWGAGCVFAELFERRPILEGKTDINQAEIIFELMGSPTEDNMPGWSQLPGCEGVRQWANQKGNIAARFRNRMGSDGLDLLQKLLTLDWRKRINAYDAIKHPYFTNAPLPARPEQIPRFEDSHELDRRKHHEKRAALPPAPAGGTVGMGPDEAWGQSGPDYYHDRSRYAPAPRDRGPPGHPAPPPPRGAPRYDDRPPAYRDARDRDRDRDRDRERDRERDRDRDRDDHRQPAWARPRPDARPPPYANGARNGSAEPGDRSRGPPARSEPGSGRKDIDTYIPTYGDRSGPPPRRDDDDPRSYRDRDVPPRRDDRDMPPRGHDYDRDRGVRRTRSRSPVSDRGRDRRSLDRDRRDPPPLRDRDAPPRDREGDRQRRERLQDREREMYRK